MFIALGWEKERAGETERLRIRLAFPQSCISWSGQLDQAHFQLRRLEPQSCFGDGERQTI